MIIDGRISISIFIGKIKEITFFDSDFLVGAKRLVQIKTATDVFKLKFKTDETFTEFTERLVFAASRFDEVKIDSSIVYKPE